jgi:hypothetical protein
MYLDDLFNDEIVSDTTHFSWFLSWTLSLGFISIVPKAEQCPSGKLVFGCHTLDSHDSQGNIIGKPFPYALCGLFGLTWSH